MKKKSSLLIAMLVTVMLGLVPSFAQNAETFRGAGQSVSGSVLTVSGGGETHRFQVTGSTKIVDSNGKPTQLAHALNQSVEVTYTGKKEPFNALKVECLEQ
jgi:hypothetical protein